MIVLQDRYGLLGTMLGGSLGQGLSDGMTMLQKGKIANYNRQQRDQQERDEYSNWFNGVYGARDMQQGADDASPEDTALGNMLYSLAQRDERYLPYWVEHNSRNYWQRKKTEPVKDK